MPGTFFLLTALLVRGIFLYYRSGTTSIARQSCGVRPRLGGRRYSWVHISMGLKSSSKLRGIGATKRLMHGIGSRSIGSRRNKIKVVNFDRRAVINTEVDAG